MGIVDAFKKIVSGEEKPKDEKNQEAEIHPDERYLKEICSLCNAGNVETKWAGKFWHKKCLRRLRKMGKGFV